MKLSDIQALWQEDSVIDKQHLDDELLKISKLHAKYHEIYTFERLKLKQYEADLKVLKQEKYEFYVEGPTKETLERGWKMPARGKILKADVAQYLDSDRDLIDQSLKIGMQNEKVGLLDSIIKMLMQRHWGIKSSIDYIKFCSGM